MKDITMDLFFSNRLNSERGVSIRFLVTFIQVGINVMVLFTRHSEFLSLPLLEEKV